MRSSQIGVLALVFLALSGCGTLHNLKDAPNGPMFCGTGCCYPFGGVTRSSLLAIMGPPIGLGGVIGGNIAVCRGDVGPGMEQIGFGLFLTSAGLIAIADVPLSLAGDILTYPIAYARSKEYPWATWWGEEPFRLETIRFESASDGIDTKMDDGNASPN